MAHRAGAEAVIQFGLVEEGRVVDHPVVALQAHEDVVRRQARRIGRREGGEALAADGAERVRRCLEGAGVDAVVLNLVAEREIVRPFVLEAGVQRRHVRRSVIGRIAVDVGIGIGKNRLAVERLDAVVGPVIIVLHQGRKRYLGRGFDAEGQRRRDAVVLYGHVLARRRRAVLRHHVDAQGRSRGQGIVDVERGAREAVAGKGSRTVGQRVERRLARHLVDGAARRAATEQHRRWAHQDLDLFQREGVAVILAAIAKAVEIDVGARGEAVEIDIVADLPAFGAAQRDARHVAQGVGQGGGALRLQQGLVEHADRLRHILGIGAQLGHRLRRRAIARDDDGRRLVRRVALRLDRRRFAMSDHRLGQDSQRGQASRRLAAVGVIHVCVLSKPIFNPGTFL